MRRLLTVAFLFAVASVANEAAGENLRLRVKPILCVIDKLNPSCDMSFIVLWESAESGYYCLFNDFDEAPLRCWASRREGEMTDDRTVEEDFSFWMTGENLADRLAQVDIEVLRLDSDDRRRRRRTRHVWDIN